ncbi:hypothetical protein [Streptomyces sp. NPDC007991]|uniref:hypothetical protein n=1 Tax=Streptomyces sp. NPDC007991 TaxID=3364803 RepID=UPI0036E0A479
MGSGESRGSSSGGGKKRLVVSNSGGAYNDALTKAIYEPFTKETGITVTTVNYQSAQVIAQVKQGRPQVHLMDNTLLILGLPHGQSEARAEELGRLLEHPLLRRSALVAER